LTSQRLITVSATDSLTIKKDFGIRTAVKFAVNVRLIGQPIKLSN